VFRRNEIRKNDSRNSKSLLKTVKIAIFVLLAEGLVDTLRFAHEPDTPGALHRVIRRGIDPKG